MSGGIADAFLPSSDDEKSGERDLVLVKVVDGTRAVDYNPAGLVRDAKTREKRRDRANNGKYSSKEDLN